MYFQKNSSLMLVSYMFKYYKIKKIEEVEQYWQGETYLVPTFVDLLSGYYGPEGYHENGGFHEEIPAVSYLMYPIYPHLHNDKENGQELPHYHVDMRFAPKYSGWPTRIYPDQWYSHSYYI